MSKAGLDFGRKNLAEKIRPAVVRHNADPTFARPVRERVAIWDQAVERRQKIDAGIGVECLSDGDQFEFLERVGDAAGVAQEIATSRLGRRGEKTGANLQ